MTSITRKTVLDQTAVCLSALCTLHCVALPAVSVLLPALASVAEAEWVHKTLVLIAVPVSVLAFVQSIRTDVAFIFGLLVSIGLGLLLTGAFFEPMHDYETLLTLSGAAFVCLAHVLRWRHFRT